MVIEFQDFLGIFHSWNWKNTSLIAENFAQYPCQFFFLSPASKSFPRSEEVLFSMLGNKIFPLVSNPGNLSEDSGLGTASNPWFAPPPRPCPRRTLHQSPHWSQLLRSNCAINSKGSEVSAYICLCRTADCAASSWRYYSPAAHADVIVLFYSSLFYPWPCLFYGSLCYPCMEVLLPQPLLPLLNL